MKEYISPKLMKIQIEPGIAFAAYTCQPSITDIKVDGVCKVNPQIDEGFGGYYCYDAPTAPAQ